MKVRIREQKGGEPESWQEVTASRWECVGYKLTGKEERGDVLGDSFY